MGPPQPLPPKAHQNPQTEHSRHNSITVTQQEGRSETVLPPSANRIGWLGFPSFWCILVETVHPPPTGWGSAGKWSNKLWSRKITPLDREKPDKGPAIHRPCSSRLFCDLSVNDVWAGRQFWRNQDRSLNLVFPNFPKVHYPDVFTQTCDGISYFHWGFFCKTQNRWTIEMSL